MMYTEDKAQPLLSFFLSTKFVGVPNKSRSCFIILNNQLIPPIKFVSNFFQEAVDFDFDFEDAELDDLTILLLLLGEMAKSLFKQEHDLEKRRAEAARIREKYPDRIPVIVEKGERSDVPNIDKKKYLVPADLTVGQFVYVIRKRIKLSAEKAIFIFVDNALPPTGAIMSAIYEEKKDDDGFLYVTYSGENTFGNH
ncbi:hypothetical protein L2E82_06191 [Cichorium intybus]|uniref:Uncharacterized protein n=1 Tax=Cichorium intybus TaxID=13427 RepID=A0ACB9HAG3_CICIN|nr:hypothetical protein L2E82_06191 [Cichorium intybus]